MFEPYIQSLRSLTRRRVVTIAVVGTVAVGCAVVAPPVIDALRYDSLVAEQRNSRASLTDAQQSAVDAQVMFESAAADSMKEYVGIGVFLQTVDPKLLADKSTLDDLSASRSSLKDRAGIHESPWMPEKLTLFEAAPDPRIPAATSPVTVEGLNLSLDRNRRVVESFSQAASRFAGQADDIHAEIERAQELTERVLRSAAKYGTSRDILKYTKADVLVKVHLNSAIGDLTDESLDPVERFTAFQSALYELKKSHSANVEAERIAKEKAEAEKRAAEEARIAEEEKRAAEEAARTAREEAARQAEEDAKKPKPTPAPTPKPTPTPTPTPEPDPED